MMWMIPGNFADFISHWNEMCPKKKVKSIWMASVHTVAWRFGLRNKRIFQNTEVDYKHQSHNSMRCLGIWAKKCKQYFRCIIHTFCSFWIRPCHLEKCLYCNFQILAIDFCLFWSITSDRHFRTYKHYIKQTPNFCKDSTYKPIIVTRPHRKRGLTYLTTNATN